MVDIWGSKQIFAYKYHETQMLLGAFLLLCHICHKPTTLYSVYYTCIWTVTSEREPALYLRKALGLRFKDFSTFSQMCGLKGLFIMSPLGVRAEVGW